MNSIIFSNLISTLSIVSLVLLASCSSTENKPEIEEQGHNKHESNTKELSDADIKSIENTFLNNLKKDEFTISSQEEPDRFRIFENVNHSGSSQFSKATLKKILEKIKQHNTGKTIAIIDCRQEMHLLGDGDLEKYIAEKDWSEMNYKLGAIIADENAYVHQGLIEREETIAHKMNLKYVRIPITDDATPHANDIDNFISFYRHETKNDAKTWFHCHCEHGHGRTTTIMAMAHMLQTKGEEPLGDILKTQHSKGGADLAFSSKVRVNGDLELRRARFGFLQEFHQYVKDKKHGYFSNNSWSQWKKSIEQ